MADGNACASLGLTTAVNTHSVLLAECLNDRELALAAAIFTQLGDTLDTIAVQRSLCSGESGG